MTREQYQQVLAQRQQQQGGSTGGFGNTQQQKTQTPSSNQWSVVKQPPKQPGFFSSLAKGVADVALQPARFIERAGKGLGESLATIGMTPEQKTQVRQKTEAFMGPGVQETIAKAHGMTPEEQKQYSTEGYKTGKEALGGALQAGANLATPFVGGVGGMALQSAALAGGKTLEEGGSFGEAAVSGAIGGVTGAALGKAGEYLGTAVGKGVGTLKDTILKNAVPLAKKLAPLTGISEKEVQMAFEKYPQQVAENLSIIRGATNEADAESALRESLVGKVKTVYEAAKEKAGQEFQTGLDALKQEFPNAKGSRDAMVGSFKQLMKENDVMAEKELVKQGRGYGTKIKFTSARTEDAQMMERMWGELEDHADYSIDGMRALKDKIYKFVDAAEPGSREQRTASLMWDEVDKELDLMTNGKASSVTRPYAQFKKTVSEMGNALNPKAQESTRRNFLANLESQAKTGSRDALKMLEEKAGMPDEATGAITAYRLAKKLSKDVKPTGSRLAELGLAGGIYQGAGMLGEAIGGEKGKEYGHIIGGLAAGKMIAPAMIAKILTAQSKEMAVPMTSAVRQRIGKLIANPKTAQVLFRTLQQMFQGQEQQNTTTDTGGFNLGQ